MGGDDVARRVNEVFRPVGLGAFHGAVEVFAREWSYGSTEEGSGVFSCEPRGCPQHAYRESVAMGETLLSRQEVRDLLHELEWPGQEYDLLRHNCCHWSDEFCKRLGVGPIPAWVNHLAGEVANLDDGIKKIDDGVRKATANAKAVIEEWSSTTEAAAANLDDGIKKIDDGVRKATANAKAVIEDARSKTLQFNNQIRDTVESKADEFRGNVEVAARDFLTKAEDLDKKLKSSVSTVAEDIARQTQAALEAVRLDHLQASLESLSFSPNMTRTSSLQGTQHLDARSPSGSSSHDDDKEQEPQQQQHKLSYWLSG